MRTSRGVLGAIVVATLLASSPAGAALPFALKPRPRLFADPATIAKLRATVFEPLPLTGALFPKEGRLTFSVKLAKAQPGDAADASLFDGYASTRRHLFVRHYDADATDAGDCPLQIAFQDSGSYAAAWTLHATCDAWHTLSFTWTGGAVTAALDGTEDTKTVPSDYAPDGQAFTFAGRGDVFDDVSLAASVAPGAPALVSFPFAEGKGDTTLSSDAAQRMRLSGTFAWADHGAGDHAVALSSGPSGANQQGKLAMLGHSDLIGTYAGLQALLNDKLTALPGMTDMRELLSCIKPIGLAWLLTDDDQYRTALFTVTDRLLEATIAPDADDRLPAARAAGLGIVYDWLYADVSTRTHAASGNLYKDDIFDTVRSAAELAVGFLCGGGSNPPFDPGWSCPDSAAKVYVSGGHGDEINADLTAGVLALVDDYPELENLALLDLHFERDLVGPYRDYMCVDGGHDFGYDYGLTYSQVRGPRAWQTATDVDAMRPYIGNLAYHVIYGMRSDDYFPAIGDAFRARGTTDPEAIPQVLLASNRFGNGYAETFFRAHHRNQPYAAITDQLLMWNPDAPTAPLEDLPLARHFRVAGEVTVRESWDYAKSALFELHGTDYYSGNHQHLDNGSFSLYYKAPLLVDSGIYDLYGTTHWNNYYRRTIAHNAMILFDPDEQHVEYGETLSNDGGQRWTREYPSLAEVQPGGVASRKGITRFEHASAYTYAQSDVSDSYDAKKLAQDRGWIRSVAWLPSVAGAEHPVFFVHDEVNKAAGKGGLTTRILFHSVNEPTPSGGDHVRTCHWKMADPRYVVANEGAAAEIETLLPAGASIEKVGGFDGASDCRFLAWNAAGDETNYPPLQQYDPHFTPNGDKRYRDMGDWRLEVSPPAPLQHEEFLHFVAITDEGEAGPKPSLVNATGAVAATVGGRTVAFASSTDDVTVDAAVAGGLLVVGLAPSARYSVTQGGAKTTLERDDAGSVAASDQGVVYLTPNSGTDGGAGDAGAAGAGGSQADAGGAETGTGGASGDGAAPADGEASGCGCRAVRGAGASSGALLALAALAVGTARRRRSRSRR